MATRRFLYEVLVRGKSDGSLQGAHQIFATQVIDDETGEVLMTKEGFAEPLNVDDVKALISEKFVGMAGQIAGLQADLKAAQRDLAKAAEANRQLQAERDELLKTSRRSAGRHRQQFNSQ